MFCSFIFNDFLLGHYISTTFTHKGFVHLDSPEKNTTSKKCLTFFYSFHGHSQFHLYDNNFLKLIIRPFNIGIWQKSQLNLDEGVHKLRFSVFLNSSNDKLALDSISTSPGSCPQLGKYFLHIFLTLLYRLSATHC